MKILVCEDNESLREFYKLAFKSMGEEADFTANGRECLDGLRSQPYDVLLLDLIMPVVDGFTVLQTAKQEFPKLKVVIVSVQDDRRAVEEVLQQGATAYLTKPFTAKHLEELIHRLMADG